MERAQFFFENHPQRKRLRRKASKRVEHPPRQRRILSEPLEPPHLLSADSSPFLFALDLGLKALVERSTLVANPNESEGSGLSIALSEIAPYNVEHTSASTYTEGIDSKIKPPIKRASCGPENLWARLETA